MYGGHHNYFDLGGIGFPDSAQSASKIRQGIMPRWLRGMLRLLWLRQEVCGGRGRIEKDIFNVLFLFLAFPEKRNMLYCTLKVWKGSRRRVCHKTVEPKQRMKSVPQEGRKARDG
jgi:hypothetical protein